MKNTYALDILLLWASLHSWHPPFHFFSLSQVEEGLSNVAAESGTQVQRLVDLVKENGELQREIKASLEKQVMQQIIDAVVRSDRDGNFTLTPRETSRLKAHLTSMDGIKFSAANFDNMIASDENELTLTDVMRIIRNLLDDEVAEKDNVFLLDPESLANRKTGVRALLPF